MNNDNLRLAAAAAVALLLPSCAHHSSTTTAAMTPVAAPRMAAERPLLPVHDVASVNKSCDEGLARARAMIAAMESKAGGEGLLREWNDLRIAMQDTSGPIGLMTNVHPDKAVRDAAEPCVQKYGRLSTELFQNDKLFARFRDVKAANEREAKLKRDLLEGFEDSGVALPPQKRARAREIFARLTELAQKFGRNVREDPTRVVMKPAEMEGMTEAYLKAQKRDAEGNYVLGLENPAYIPFMTNAKSEDARKRYYIARQRKGGEENLALMEEMYRLRKELAGLYGYPSFADYTLRRRMSGSSANVQKFLAEVKTAVTEVEKKELAELSQAKARAGGGGSLRQWDVSYYQEAVRKARFDVDQERLRKYFPTPKAIDFTLKVSEDLYGVKFTEVKVPVWHPDVRYFDVHDARTGEFLSGFYLDLYPRDGKYAHAAAAGVRGSSMIAGRTPISVLMTNFDRVGLTQGEFRTLMHEFGHVLHGVLSRTDYLSQAGTSVKRDFVEAPSQMFEEWARREQSLALFKNVCAECPQLTSAEIERLDEARRFGSGYQYARQWSYAALDMELSLDPRPPLQVWKEIESKEPLGAVEGALFPSSFEHLAGGYAAGYYGYMWSQVLALDMLSPFKANMLDRELGRRYRETILAQGSQQDEMQMVRSFLGRAPSNEAFFAEITGKR